MKLGKLPLFIVWFPVAVSAADAPIWSNPRGMPSLRVRWQRSGEPCALVARGDTVYVLEPGRVVALEAERGHVRWEHAIETDQCPYNWQSPLVVLEQVVVAAADDHLFVIDRASGTRRQTVPLGGRFSTMWASPVLVEVEEGQRRDLIAVDPLTGQINGRHSFRSGIYGLQVADQVALVLSQSPSVIALRLPGLAPLWSAAGFSGVGVVAGRTVLGRRVQEGECSFEDVFPVDPANGRLGARLFRREPSDDRARASWDFAFVENEAGFFLRHVRPTDGQLLWETELPDRTVAWRQAGDRLYAHCSRTGRGFLLVLDSATGRITDAAYGLRDVYGMDLSGDELLLLTGAGVVAISSREFGPPEATSLPVAEAVRRALSTATEFWRQAESLRDLKALGAEGLPALTDEVHRLAGWPLAVAASWLGLAGHKEAAPALAERLELNDVSPPGNAAAIALMDALAVVGGPAQVRPIQAVLESRDRGEVVKFHAFMALASIGTPEALEAATKALADRRERARTGFAPPSAAPFVDLIGRPVDEAARQKAEEREDYSEWARLGRGVGCAKAPLAEGRSLVVFPDDRLGNKRDLWAQETRPDGTVAGAAIFLGTALWGSECIEHCPIEASVQGPVVTVRRKDGAGGIVRVDLTAARRDSDADGLTDYVETRLGTDPRQRDSDGDGIDDALDPFPLTPSGHPSTEIEEVTAAVFEQFSLFAEDTSDLAVLVSDFALPASGRRGPTIIVPHRRLAIFNGKSHLDGAAFITIGSSEGSGAPVAGKIAAFTGGSLVPLPPPDARDRRYDLSVYRGPLNAIGYQAVVRRTDRGWLLCALRTAWVS